MIAIKVRVNGELKAVCGVEDADQLIASVRASGKLGEQSREQHELTFVTECFGLHHNQSDRREALKWFKVTISREDEISFSFEEVESADEPIDRQELNDKPSDA